MTTWSKGPPNLVTDLDTPFKSSESRDLILSFDQNLRLRFANDAALTTLALPRQKALGLSGRDLLTHLLTSDDATRVLDAHGTASTLHCEMDAVAAHLRFTVTAIPHDEGLLVHLKSARQSVHAKDHAIALATISRRLARTRTPQDVADVLSHVLPEAIDAIFISVVLLDEKVLHTIAARGEGEEKIDLAEWGTFPLDSPAPLAAAVREGRPIFTHSREEAAREYPALLAAPPAHQAWASLPLQIEERTFGALGLSFPDQRTFGLAEREFLQAVAAQGAVALERARLLNVEQTALDRATYLASASELLASSLDPAVVLVQLADLTVPRLADCCIVYLVDEQGHLVPHAVAHHTPERADHIRAHLARFPIDMNAPIGAAKVYREGQPNIVRLPSEELLRTAALNDEHVAAVLAMGIRSVLGVPLIARGETLGVIELISMMNDRQYGEDAVTFAEDLARRAALALDNARLYTAAHATSGVLERMVEDRTRELASRTEELAARTRALEAFGVLSRDLATETDRVKLVARAQVILLSLLPRAVAAYFELDSGRWRLRCLTGELPDDTFRVALEVGLKRREAPSFDRPFDTNTPVYLNEFRSTPEHAQPDVLTQLKSTASFPVGAGEHLFGVLVIALYQQHGWTPVDKVLLETALSKLRLALERADAVADLARRTRELEEVNAELEAFTSTVSHDLRAPLRHIMSFSALVRRGLGEDASERVLKPLGMIEMSATRMTLLTDALLAFARTSRQPLHVQAVDLNALVREAIADLHLDVTGQLVEWHLESLPKVRGDAVLLRQVLVNLLGNAVKYSGTRDVIIVEVAAREVSGEVILSVRDYGVGFDPKYADKLFGIFARLHRAGEFEGTGIGLATVKRIVQRHGGRVWAESTLGQGATFFVALPGCP